MIHAYRRDRPHTRRLCIIACAALILTAGGCSHEELTAGEVVAQFVTDFARQALTAFLL